MINAILFLILFSRISQENSYGVAMFDSERRVLNSFPNLPLAVLLFNPYVSTGYSYAWSCGSNQSCHSRCGGYNGDAAGGQHPHPSHR